MILSTPATDAPATAARAEETAFSAGLNFHIGGDEVLTNPSEQSFEPWGGLPGCEKAFGVGIELGARVADTYHTYRLEVDVGTVYTYSWNRVHREGSDVSVGARAGLDAPRDWPITFISGDLEIVPTFLLGIGYGHSRHDLGHSEDFDDMVIERQGVDLEIVARYEIRYAFLYARAAATYRLLLAVRQRLGDPHYTDDSFSFPGLSHRIGGQVLLGVAF